MLSAAILVSLDAETFGGGGHQLHQAGGTGTADRSGATAGFDADDSQNQRRRDPGADRRLKDVRAVLVGDLLQVLQTRSRHAFTFWAVGKLVDRIIQPTGAGIDQLRRYGSPVPVIVTGIRHRRSGNWLIWAGGQRKPVGF